MKKIILTAFLIFSFVATSLAATADSSASTIAMNEFKQEIKSGKKIVILDVRSRDELTGSLGKIDGSINIPINELESRLPELNKYKNEEIRVISRSGIPSKLAAEMLRNHGFNAANVTGGMMAFRRGD
ncbi:MAG: rhodanese-like domain-containing protein [Ignavibacteriaceae bacterium]